MSKLNIFISSTCYDLSQIRQDLSDAIKSWGYNPIMSENISFPIDPACNTEENCLKTVRDEADVFVLIIGSRYGYLLDSGKSITNMEYLAAVEKGIPIYSFTLKQMVDCFPLWKDNPDINFSSCTDNPKIFEFINEVRITSNKWNFQFENATDIISTLREQLSNLFKIALDTKRKYDGADSNASSVKDFVSATAYRYLLEKKEYYEIKFFAQCMLDCIKAYSHQKSDLEYSIVSITDKCITSADDVFQYVQLMLGKIKHIVESLNSLINKAFADYFGERGCPSDIEGLYYVSKTYSKLYGLLIDCAIEARSLIAPDEYERAFEYLSLLPRKTIREIEAYPGFMMEKIQSAEAEYAKTKEPMTVQIKLDLTFDDEMSDKVLEEIKRVIFVP